MQTHTHTYTVLSFVLISMIIFQLKLEHLVDYQYDLYSFLS